MKLIHGLTIALTLSLVSPLGAQTNVPTNPPPAPAETVAPIDTPSDVSPAPAPKKATAKKPKKSAAAEPVVESKPNTMVAINPPEAAVVKQEAVNVRGRASFIGEVITKLGKGEPVTLLEEISLGKTRKGEPEKWLRIAMPTNTPVWVSTHFIDSASKTVVPKKLKVRAGPGENYSVIGELEKGDTVKEIRTVDDWVEIEAPAGTYAFVAADLIERGGSQAPIAPTAPEPVAPAVPEPAPEVVTVPPAPEAPAPAEPIASTPAPAVTPAEPIAPPVVQPEPEPAVEEPLPKRIVSREGIIRRSLNIQTPSYYELESPDTGKIINYLYSPKPGFTLKPLIGERVLVTGEELIDKRWRNTPVIEIESLITR